MVHGIGTAALVLALLLAGCRDSSKTVKREPPASAYAVDAADSAASPPSAEIVAAPPSAEAASAASPAGKYVIEIPAADASLQRISLDLRPDSTCVFKTEYVGKGKRVESGFWNGDGALVRVVIGPPRDPSKQTRFAFAAARDSLVSTEWDTTRFGAEGLGTLVRR